jgi:hypothetical protein
VFSRPAVSEDAISDRLFLKGFVAGLRELGYVEGQNITIDREFSDANADRLRELAVELVKRRRHHRPGRSCTAVNLFLARMASC